MTNRLKEEQDWRLRVFDSLSYPSLVLAPDRRIVAANRVFQQQFGASEEELVGTSCRDLFAGRLEDEGLPCNATDCPLARTLATGLGHAVQRRIEGPDGRERFEDRVFSPILDDGGVVAYVIESIRDVTRLKNLERLYSGMREFVDRVVQSSPSAIVAADRMGRLMLMNRAAEELFGWQLSTRRGANVRELYPPGIAERLMRTLRDDQAGSPGKLPPTRVDVLHASGEHMPVEMTAAIIYEDEQEVATMGIYNDLRQKIDAERQLEAARLQLLQSEKLASLGRLAAGVAHEINNPLTGILLYASLMAEALPEDHALRGQLACVLEDATRCQEIVKDLLAYSRQAVPSREPFLLGDLVAEALSHIRDQRLFLQVEVVRDLGPAPLRVCGDRRQLGQVVINLVLNALDAMNRRGRLVLRTFPLGRDRVALEVSDSGGGIAPEHRSRIFDPFFSTKEPGKGTGLGLSTAYGIVHENGGDITVAHTGPGGTTFRVVLPAAPEPTGRDADLIG